MNPKAIPKVRARLSEARAAIYDIEKDAPGLPIFQDRWHTFLVKSCSIYSILEQAAKGHNESVAWFGRKKHERKRDPLLSYLHHARNCDQYSVDGSSEKSESTVISTNRYSKVVTSNVPGKPPKLVMTVNKPSGFRILPAGFHLTRVVDDRFGDTFYPPSEHLGSSIERNDPVTVAKLALDYIEEMVNEAFELTKR